MTFEENALAKARQAAAATGLPAIADDSGLEVDALDGAPGVWSARYAGPGRRRRPEQRQAAGGAARRAGRRGAGRGFVASPRSSTRRAASRSCATAPARARSSTRPRGSDGFGYDPLFLVPALGRTMAELPLDEKNRLSHRAAAFRALALGARRRPAPSGG